MPDDEFDELLRREAAALASRIRAGISDSEMQANLDKIINEASSNEIDEEPASSETDIDDLADVLKAAIGSIDLVWLDETVDAVRRDAAQILDEASHAASQIIEEAQEQAEQIRAAAEAHFDKELRRAAEMVTTARERAAHIAEEASVAAKLHAEPSDTFAVYFDEDYRSTRLVVVSSAVTDVMLRAFLTRVEWDSGTTRCINDYFASGWSRVLEVEGTNLRGTGQVAGRSNFVAALRTSFSTWLGRLPGLPWSRPLLMECSPQFCDDFEETHLNFFDHSVSGPLRSSYLKLAGEIEAKEAELERTAIPGTVASD